MKCSAICFTGPEQLTFREYEIPPLEGDQVLVETLFSGVSTGTETRVFRGKQQGAEFPLIPGYENVGYIRKCGPAATLAVGTAVFVNNEYTGGINSSWGSHVSYSVASQRNVHLFPGEPDIEKLKAYAFCKVASIAHHGVARASVSSDDTVAVVGLGLIGQLALQIIKSKGAKVIAVDMDSERLEIAGKAGADKLINPSETDLKQAVMDYCGGVDVAVDATGIPEVLNTTAQLVHARPWEAPYPAHPRILILGSYAGSVSLDYEASLFMNEPDIFPSRDTTDADFESVISMIYKNQINPLLIPTEIVAVGEAETAYKDILNKKLTRVIFDWSREGV
ncbi:MAG: zinc-binding dehydrogenase [Spirochaetales bacterium]|nr:zinc-binding dehydrogenase [Spirochaetales bacterium]